MHLKKRKVPLVFVISFLLITIAALDICRRGGIGSNKDVIVLHVLYTSEKKGWINSVAPEFPAWFEKRNPSLKVKLSFEISGTRSSMIAILSGESKPAIWSPASSVWIPLFKWAWEKKYSSVIINSSDIQSLVVSPIVIGTWQSYAVSHNITSWSDLFRLANSDLKLAHTSAQESNSGYMSVLLEVAAACHKAPNTVTIEDLENSTVQQLLSKVESKAVLYGSSTGFLAKQAVQLGPSSINIMILYENLIIETSKDGEAFAKWGDNLTAIYPKEGTLWSDHPIVRLNASWVSKEEYFAAKEFETYLLSKKVQEEAIPFGFRPGNRTLVNDPDIIKEMNQVFKSNNGVKLNLTIPHFSPPDDGEVLDRIPDLWLKTRATTLNNENSNEYNQLGLDPLQYTLISVFGLVVLVIIIKRRRIVYGN